LSDKYFSRFGDIDMTITGQEATDKNLVIEKIAEQFFPVLDEDGPSVVFFDGNGKYLTSDKEKALFILADTQMIGHICTCLDDGADPVICSVNGCTVAVSHLVTDAAEYGYILLVLPNHTPESAVANSDIIDIVLNQAGLIARMVDSDFGHSGAFESPCNEISDLFSPIMN
jgi:hypothetical protein